MSEEEKTEFKANIYAKQREKRQAKKEAEQKESQRLEATTGPPGSGCCCFCQIIKIVG